MKSNTANYGRKAIGALGLLAVAVAMVGCSPQGVELLKEVPEPVQYSAPQPQQWQLSNGLKVMFYRDDELPLVIRDRFLEGEAVGGGIGGG